ncbi:hypothetical protein Q4076_19420, partial [Acinetobacter baumannii]
MKPDLLASALFNQVDESSTTPVSIRLPNLLINELEELSITLDKSKSFFSVHDKFHRTLILSGFCLLKIAKISLNSSFFPKPIK